MHRPTEQLRCFNKYGTLKEQSCKVDLLFSSMEEKCDRKMIGSESMKAWEANIRKVVPYVPGEQPKDTNIIKLNTNENPYPPSKYVEDAVKATDIEHLRLYPDPTMDHLVSAIAANCGIRKENVFVGVGSDDVIAMCFLTFFNSDKPIFFPDITYSFYDVWADMLKIPYETKALDDNFHMVLEDYQQENGGIIFPNPNAPTGLLEDLSLVEEIVAQNPASIVIVDEAYVDFGGKSALSLIDKYDNLLVVQTFSKSRSMAGMRIGFAMGNSELIQYLNDVKYSFNSYTLNDTAIRFGAAAVKDKEYFQETVEKIVNTREWTKKELQTLGFSFPDSKANFIFATHKTIPAEELFQALRQAKIFVRYFKKPRIDNYLRITIGTQQEMEQFIRFLREYIRQKI